MSTGHQQLELFQRVAEFNLYLVRYIHSSWLQTLKLSALVDQLRESGAADFHLSEYLLEEFGLTDSFDYDFDPPEKRIVLADEQSLQRLALYLGIILHEEVIRGVVQRKERQALEEILGAEAYRFAVKKAQFISRMAGQQGPSLLLDWDHLERFRDFLVATGLQIIDKTFAEMPEAFRRRVELKLPSEHQDTLMQMEPLSMPGEQCTSLVIKVHREVNRQWHHLLS